MKLPRVQPPAFNAAGLPASDLAPAAPMPADCMTGGFALGCQAWTFKEFSVLEAIRKTVEAGGKVIEFFPGQTLSPEIPGVKFNHDASEKMIATVKAQLEKSSIRAVNSGVMEFPRHEAGALKVSEFARNFGLYAITTESVDAIETIRSSSRNTTSASASTIIRASRSTRFT